MLSGEALSDWARSGRMSSDSELSGEMLSHSSYKLRYISYGQLDGVSASCTSSGITLCNCRSAGLSVRDHDSGYVDNEERHCV